MFTRREAAVGGLLTILSGSLPCICRAEEVRTRHTFGCVLDDDEVDQYLSPSTKVQLLAFTGNEPIIGSSGDREFDYALAQTLSRITDTFRVLPGFAFFDDFDKPNAYANPTSRLGRRDGTVLFGQHMLRRTLAWPESPDAAVTSVCAHEFGHILQYKLNLKRTLLAGQSTTKRLELHADYLAGYYAGLCKLRNSNYPAAVYATFMHSGGSYNANHPKFHGLPDERAAAVVRGFEVAYRERRNLGEAVQIGVNYVMTL
jgi:hypothetical protein